MEWWDELKAPSPLPLQLTNREIILAREWHQARPRNGNVWAELGARQGMGDLCYRMLTEDPEMLGGGFEGSLHPSLSVTVLGNENDQVSETWLANEHTPLPGGPLSSSLHREQGSHSCALHTQDPRWLTQC